MNRSEIMTSAWNIFRKNNGTITFGEALHRAWQSYKAKPINTARIEAAKAEAGITEEINTWYGWKQEGYEVIHESKAVMCVELIWASRGDNATYKAYFFTESQVAPIAA